MDIDKRSIILVVIFNMDYVSIGKWTHKVEEEGAMVMVMVNHIKSCTKIYIIVTSTNHMSSDLYWFGLDRWIAHVEK